MGRPVADRHNRRQVHRHVILRSTRPDLRPIPLLARSKIRHRPTRPRRNSHNNSPPTPAARSGLRIIQPKSLPRSGRDVHCPAGPLRKRVELGCLRPPAGRRMRRIHNSRRSPGHHHRRQPGSPLLSTARTMGNAHIGRSVPGLRHARHRHGHTGAMGANLADRHEYHTGTNENGEWSCLLVRRYYGRNGKFSRLRR
jgi:hypothetical protein